MFTNERRHPRRRTHLDPCSEPPLSSYQSFIYKYGITVLAFCTAALLTSLARNNGLTPDAFQNSMNIIEKEKDYVLAAIAQVDKTKKEIENIIYQMNYIVMIIKDNTDCNNGQKQRNNDDNRKEQYEDTMKKKNSPSISTVEEPMNLTQECDKKCPIEETAAIIDKKVQEALDKYDADKTGMADYALESAGGMILSTGKTLDFREDDKITLFGMTICSKGKGPEMIINPSMQPGNCWAFKGESGLVVIQLASMIKVTGVTLEHIPKTMAPSQQVPSAPREFSIYGIYETKAIGRKTESVYFGRFLYDIDSTPVQYFPIDTCKLSVEIIEIRFHNNHGNSDYTCVYRVRVHGITK